MVDKDLLNSKLQELERYITQLSKHRGVTSDKLANDLDEAWIIQHGLLLCIQVVLDMGNHILADAGVSVNEYADIFPQLGRLGVIPEDYAVSIKGMAGLRNLLVHEYSELDMDTLAGVVNNRLNDFTRFGTYVLKYMEKIKEIVRKRKRLNE